MYFHLGGVVGPSVHPETAFSRPTMSQEHHSSICNWSLSKFECSYIVSYMELHDTVSDTLAIQLYTTGLSAHKKGFFGFWLHKMHESTLTQQYHAFLHIAQIYHKSLSHTDQHLVSYACICLYMASISALTFRLEWQGELCFNARRGCIRSYSDGDYSKVHIVLSHSLQASICKWLE